MSGLDAAILLGFSAVAIAFGLRARERASTGLDEYFLAGRSLRGWQAGASMAATQFAADTPLLVTGLIATAGIFSLWRLWIYAVAFLLLGFLLAPLWRRARVLTDAELAELRYGAAPAAWLRGVKALYFGTIFNCTVLAMVLWAAKEIAEPFLLWDQWLPSGLFGAAEAFVHAVGVPFAREHALAGDLWLRSTNNLLSLAALILVTTLYSATGGLRSVVQTDLLQLTLMLGGTAAYAAVVVHEVGGLGALPEQLAARFPAGHETMPSASELLAFTPSRARDATFAVLAVLGLQWLVQMNADGTGYLAQRAMACRSDEDARTAAIVFTGLQVVLRSLLWLPLGLGLLLLYPIEPGALASAGGLSAEREATFVRGMAELLPSGLRGLMLTAMLAALASTIDTHMNWGASYWTHDLYRRFFCEAWQGRTPGGRELVWVARASNLLILAFALVIVTQLSSIQTAWQLSLLLGAGMGVPLILRWLWWRITAAGELAAIAASALLAPLLLATEMSEAARLLSLAFVATAAAVGASLLFGAESRETLEGFYERVRPPGFWGPYGRRDDAARLARSLASTALASGACFCLLVGAGTLLVGGSAPQGWPGGGAGWALVNLIAATLLAVACGRSIAAQPGSDGRA